MKAIILAAGMGTRLRPLTDEIPKCLVEVNGEPMVERQIRFLQEAGIEEITLASGYKAGKLDYLKEKFGVDIVFNEKFEVCNNIWSIYSVLDRFSDTYVIEGDIYMSANCFGERPATSSYYSVWRDEEVNEWGLSVDADGKLTSIEVGMVKGFIMAGVSYWTPEDCDKIADEIRRLVREGNYQDLFWDNAVINICQSLDIQVHRFDGLHEVDTEEDLKALEKYLRNS